MKAIEVKPDMQVNLFCPTCRRQTKQAMVEGLQFHCTVCCQDHTLEENTQQAMHALMELMRESQKAVQKLTTH